MVQYYWQREGTGDFTVRATTGQNSEVIAHVATKRAAMRKIDRLNTAALTRELQRNTGKGVEA